MLFTINHKQKVPSSLAKVWSFFSNPENLSVLTPPSLGFKLTSGSSDKMYAGQIITYHVTPLFGVPVQWVTEITHVQEPFLFVDEQRVGPYRMWHHQHLFRETPGGVELEDRVHYTFAVPVIDSLLNGALIAPRLNEVFDYRRKKVIELFGVL